MDRPRAMEAALVRVTVGCSLVLLAWMGRALISGEVPFTGDLLHWNYPIRDFYARALASGWSVEWMPAMFAGTDIAGEGQLGVYHPLHWVLYRLMPLDRAFMLEVVGFYPVLLAGMWLWLRRYCGAGAAGVGAVSFAFGGFALSHVVHVNMVAVVAHVPWLLLAVDGLFGAPSRSRRARGCAAVALLVGSQLLFGHPQAAWWSVLLVGAYATLLWASKVGGAPRASWVWVLAGGVLGTGVGAVQVLTTSTVVAASTRALEGRDFATTFSLPPLHLLQLVAPYALWGRVLRWNEVAPAPDEFAVYAGAVVLTLAVWWLAAYRDLRASGRVTTADRLAWWALGVAVVGAWLALGRAGGLYSLHTWLPVVGQFRAPVRFILLTQFGLAVVGAVAVSHLLALGREGAASTARGWWAPWVLAGVSIVGAIWIARSAVSVTPPSTEALVAGPLLFVTAAALVTGAVRGVRWAPLVLVLLAAADAGVYGLGGVAAWHDFLSRAEAVALLDTHESNIPSTDGRIVRGGFPNLYMIAGFRALDGYAGLTPRRQLDYHLPNALRVAEVRYAHADFLGKRDVPGAERLARGWIRLPPPLPRARLVAESRVSHNPAVEIDGLDVARVALTERAVTLEAGAEGRATIGRDQPGLMVVTTSAPGRQLLVVSESFDRGWSARVDGTSAEVERVYGDFLGVVVPEGTHEVTLAFRPVHARLGMLISVASVLAALILAVR